VSIQEVVHSVLNVDGQTSTAFAQREMKTYSGLVKRSGAKAD
jgi:hypothetical protein